MADTETIIARAIAFGDSGALCYAEMWNIISECLKTKDVEVTLNQLSPIIRRSLIEALSQSPGSINVSAEPSETRKAIVDWCHRSN